MCDLTSRHRSRWRILLVLPADRSGKLLRLAAHFDNARLPALYLDTTTEG